MYMFKARIAAEKEVARAYEESGVTETEVRAFLDAHPEYASPLHHARHKVACSAANLIFEVAPLIKESALTRASKKARAAAGHLRDAAIAAPGAAKKAVAFARDPETRERLGQDFALVRELVEGKAKERLVPLAQQLLGKAVFENNREVSTVGYGDEPIAAE
jgi:hypothetical protein